MAEGLLRNENRTLIRHELIYYLKVTNRQTNLEMGRLGDIHIEGMLVFTPEDPLPEQTVYDLLLELPKALAESEGYLELPILAQTLWNKPDPRLSNYYLNGLRFLSLTGQAQRVIRDLTEIFAMPGRDPRP
jgi:hypothetical protein